MNAQTARAAKRCDLCTLGGLCVAFVIATTACAPRLTKLPTGAGTLATDIAEVNLEATTTCQQVSALTAEIAVRGSVDGSRVGGRLLAGFSLTSGRLEAVAPFGAPLFIFVATDDDGTLLFPRDARVVEHGSPPELLEAVAGVPLKAGELLRAMTGCLIPEQVRSPQALAADWRTVAGAGGAKVYFHRDGTPARWHVVSVFHPGSGLQWSWRADYDDFHAGIPHVVRFVSADGKRFNIQLALSQVQTNLALGPEVFRVEVPRDAERITVDDLRQSGPLATPKRRER